MSHSGTGYFYYRYTYHCPFTNTATNTTGTDDTYHSAVYTAVMKQDHSAQTAWFKNRAMPAIRADILRNFYTDADRNRQGRTYERFNEAYVRELEFMYCTRLPVHSTGVLRGQPFGKEI